MKKIFTTLIIILLSTVYAQDFRNITWGMSREEVKAAETLRLYQEDEDGLFYTGKVAELNVLLFYEFTKSTNQLAYSAYLFLDDYVNENSYISDYNAINTILKNKYGTPTSEKETWFDDLYKDDPGEKGLAISIGHHSLSTYWNSEKTNIHHWLTGENFEIKHSISYTSNEFYPLLEEEYDQQNANDF